MKLSGILVAALAVAPLTAGPTTGGPANVPLVAWAEPATGYGLVYRFILSAHHSLDMTMYELGDRTAENDLATDAAHGVDVRVLLDSAYHGAKYNQPAYNYLSAHGVHVEWAPSSVIVHQKTITADDRASLIMTSNLTSEYYRTSADFIVEDTKPTDVATIVRAFDDDWRGDLARSPYGVPVRGEQGDLVFSPASEATLVKLISSAKRSLKTSSEEMDSYPVESALEAAARRGVEVEVLMTQDPSWDYAFDHLKASGVQIRLYPYSYNALYIHAKTMIVDNEAVYVGSINYSTASMTYNRELGVVTSDAAVVGLVERAWANWWSAAPIKFS